MSKETTAQKNKKNKSRIRIEDRALYPSIQRSYSKKKKPEIINVNQIQFLW